MQAEATFAPWDMWIRSCYYNCTHFADERTEVQSVAESRLKPCSLISNEWGCEVMKRALGWSQEMWLCHQLSPVAWGVPPLGWASVPPG